MPDVTRGLTLEQAGLFFRMLEYLKDTGEELPEQTALADVSRAIHVNPRTLKTLDWPRVRDRLRRHIDDLNRSTSRPIRPEQTANSTGTKRPARAPGSSVHSGSEVQPVVKKEHRSSREDAAVVRSVSEETSGLSADRTPRSTSVPRALVKLAHTVFLDLESAPGADETGVRFDDAMNELTTRARAGGFDVDAGTVLAACTAARNSRAPLHAEEGETPVEAAIRVLAGVLARFPDGLHRDELNGYAFDVIELTWPGELRKTWRQEVTGLVWRDSTLELDPRFGQTQAIPPPGKTAPWNPLIFLKET